uniref:Mannosyl-glycoprotein endo-beta-N-acetylglucosaminidase n=1 Tax=Acrobeloides nanus TaxID=290746 RepID=A0A914CJ30_9BILA
MKGGYLEQDKLEGCILTDSCYPYLILHWWSMDIFCYFSHHFITVPPVVWTEQAHKHGVIVLGTFITEFEGGEKLCEKIFSSQEVIDELIEKMIQLCINLNFEGWLINIENIMKPELLPNLEYFLKELTQKSRQILGKHSRIIWYDSVTNEGKLDWQNELNLYNRKWFDLTDGIYLNYAWNEEHLQRTLELAAGQRLTEIYLGVDVFGRGCMEQVARIKKFFRHQPLYKQFFSSYINPYTIIRRWTLGISYLSCGQLFPETSKKMILQNRGGGGWNCSEPLELIKKYGLSLALFAPGWIIECFVGECVLENSFRFWSPIKEFLPIQRPLTSSEFDTDFSSGITLLPDGTKHFKMTSMGLQPHYLDSTNLYLTLSGLKIISGGEHILFLCDSILDELPKVIKAVSIAKIGIKLVIEEDQEVILVHEENSGGEEQVFVIPKNVKHIKKIYIQVQKEDCPMILKSFSMSNKL